MALDRLATQSLPVALWVALHHLAPAVFGLVCASLVLIFLLLCCIPAIHVWVRGLIRPWAIFHVEEGLAWNKAAQRLEHPWLTYLFDASSATVSVPFYVSWRWNVFVIFTAMHWKLLMLLI